MEQAGIGRLNSDGFIYGQHFYNNQLKTQVNNPKNTCKRAGKLEKHHPNSKIRETLKNIGGEALARRI